VTVAIYLTGRLLQLQAGLIADWFKSRLYNGKMAYWWAGSLEGCDIRQAGSLVMTVASWFSSKLLHWQASSMAAWFTGRLVQPWLISRLGHSCSPLVL
jgi:hypothetical protein